MLYTCTYKGVYFPNYYLTVVKREGRRGPTISFFGQEKPKRNYFKEGIECFLIIVNINVAVRLSKKKKKKKKKKRIRKKVVVRTEKLVGRSNTIFL